MFTLVKGRLDISKHVYLMLAVLLVFWIGTGTLEFNFDTYIEGFVQWDVLIFWIIALGYLAAFIVNVPFGNLADKIGARVTVTISLLVLTIIGYFYTVAFILVFVIGVIFLWGGFLQGVIIGGEAYIRKKTKGHASAKAIGFMETVMMVGFGLGPIIAGYISEMYSSKFIFYFFSLACLIGFLVSFSIKRVHRPRKKSYSLVVEEDKGTFLKTIKHFAKIEHSSHHVALVILFVGFIFAAWDALIWFTIARYPDLGILDVVWAGYIETIFMLTLVPAFAASGFIVERAGRKNTIISGFLLAMVFSFMFTLFIGQPALMALYAFFISWGVGVAFPAVESLLTDLGYKKDMGKISGVYNMSKDFGYIFGTAMTGSFVLLWAGAGFFFTGFLFAAAVGAVAALLKD